ncbi:hypothetical protein P9A44_gp58 [Xanthomonas phage vB_Xar_IVIA-DoCa5]|uniref:Uncharacterized protein n=1 Tax=Xanthomonas phage vB_Xar_IVIA-DoCa5 TaxID=2975532 RepID=A0A9X9JN72_9CAUD|nr:hypothetical protein P9A44_gp58 [Xanthomonas phage vB_Xar_IVIA-DoCa5]UYA98728.1 hypothetical protein IVIADoCa5_58 [Xanthomonas phage vB_Xar_IVIA-DoCa5]
MDQFQSPEVPDMQKAVEHYRGELDRMQGQLLREALDKVGPGGRIVVTRLHDEILFTMEVLP